MLRPLNFKKIGIRIKAIRRYKKMTQSKFGDSLGGFSPGFISQLETGMSAPSLQILHSIYIVFKVPIPWILYGKKNNR